MLSNTYNIVVAVPTNNSCAFSPPALVGWNFVALASGRESGNVAPVGRSLVAGCAWVGSRVRCFIVRLFGCFRFGRRVG